MSGQKIIAAFVGATALVLWGTAIMAPKVNITDASIITTMMVLIILGARHLWSTADAK